MSEISGSQNVVRAAFPIITPEELLAECQQREDAASVEQALEVADLVLELHLQGLLFQFPYRNELSSGRAQLARSTAVALERVRSARASRKAGASTNRQNVGSQRKRDTIRRRIITAAYNCWTAGADDARLRLALEDKPAVECTTLELHREIAYLESRGALIVTRRCRAPWKVQITERYMESFESVKSLLDEVTA